MKFKNGDEVKVNSQTFPSLDGKRGTVQDIDTGSDTGYPYHVVFDDGAAAWFWEDELTLWESMVNAAVLPPDPVTEPEHYKAGVPEGVEVIDIIREQGLLFEFSLGNAIKYVLRAKYKGALKQDLRKARQYLDWAIESAPEED